MMSAAILMTEAVEKVSVRPASSDLSFDKGEPDGISFAMRFNEPVGDSGSLQKNKSAGEGAIALPNSKSVAASANAALGLQSILIRTLHRLVDRKLTNQLAAIGGGACRAWVRKINCNQAD
jgi:hypothetical protein